jgi:MFS family permease
MFSRLSVMMFLEYSIRAVWTACLVNYLGAPLDAGGLGFSPAQTGWILSLAATVGAFSAPLVGQLADRYVNAERALAALLAVTGVALVVNARATSFGAWVALSCLASLAYQPTVPLTNGITFANVADPVHRYPAIRAFGTLGWIVVSSLFTLLWLARGDRHDIARMGDAVMIAGIIALAFAAYAVTVLPRTPPRRDVHREALGRAIRVFAHRGLLVFTLVSLVAAVANQCLYNRLSAFFQESAGVSPRWLGPAMALGQVTEIAMLVGLGPMVARLGFKTVFAIGLSAFVLRFLAFAAAPHATAIVLSAQALHGICFATIFAAGFVYVEHVSPADVRHSAQALFAMITLGVGPLLGGALAQAFATFRGETPGHLDYRGFWFLQAAVAGAALITLLVLFPSRATARPQLPLPACGEGVGGRGEQYSNSNPR